MEISDSYGRLYLEYYPNCLHSVNNLCRALDTWPQSRGLRHRSCFSAPDLGKELFHCFKLVVREKLIELV